MDPSNKGNTSVTIEFELLRQLGSESSQVMLAHEQFKAEELIWMPDNTVGVPVQMLYERCGYQSLPGYLLGWCLMGRLYEHSSWNLETYVAPLLRPPVPHALYTQFRIFYERGESAWECATKCWPASPNICVRMWSQTVKLHKD